MPADPPSPDARATAEPVDAALLRAISETSSDVIFAKDLAGRLTYANPATLALIGKPAEQVLGRTDLEFLDDEAAARAVMENDRRIMEGGVAVELEERIPLPDGTPRIWLSRKAPYRDGSGRVIGLLGISRDITGRKADAEALRVERETLAAVIGVLPVGVGITDAMGNTLSMNRAGLAMHGFASREEMLHQLTEYAEQFEICAVDGAPLPAEAWPASRAMRGEYVTGLEVRVRNRRAGTDRVVSYSCAPVRGADGAAALLVYAMQDVTELRAGAAELERANAALREADRRKDEFLAMLSHELRNPLAPIRNGVYVLERVEPGSPQAIRAREVIDRQTQHLSRLVDDLLDVTRVSRGKINLHRERVELGAIVRAAADDHRAQFEAGGVELEVSAPAAALLVDGDPTRLAQIVGNLLHNAAKFTPRGGRATVALDADGDEVVLAVRDTGSGMDPALVGQLFEPFMQAAATLDRSRGGLGLGLALVKGLVELHGGTIAASSDGPGRGAEFVVRLPRVVAASAPAASPVAARASGGRAILIIEDNVDAAESLKEVLELGDHRVEVAHDGHDGIAKARALRPDVVLCDLGLPGVDGFEVARALRADPALRGTFLVALSGYARPEDVARTRDAGFDRHLAKPPSLDALRRMIDEVPRT